ncbi:MAG: ATP-dependent endonuclease [Actinomycetota bacterium]|nr:ATP-dependent endonuclease [Actinomycetota bacterium]
MSVQVPAVQRVVLVEGPSDAAVLRVLADARGRSLEDEGVDVISMGGATNIGHYLRRFGPRGRRLILAGLCDAGEEPFFRRALQGEGFSTRTRDEMARQGFYVCDVDLEDELLRALGVEAVEAILEREGELGLFRRFQWQPAQRQRSIHDQLHRFAGVRSGRKVRFAASMASELTREDVPAPLRALLEFVIPADE